MNIENFINKLDDYSKLEDGWDSYKAPKPSLEAIDNAKMFLTNCDIFNTIPTHVHPSVVGGIGITFRKEPLEVYVEFLNNKKTYALFSNLNNIDLSYILGILDYIDLIDKIGCFFGKQSNEN